MKGQLKTKGDMESRKTQTEPELDRLFVLSDQLSELGRLREAFRVTKVGAEAGDRSMQLNLGYLYDIGRGVRKNRERAMYWYKRAYLKGDDSAANNIGTIYRDEKRWRLALRWFRRAVSMGNDDANYEIAKVLLAIGEPSSQARPYLRRVLRSDRACELSQEQAAELLKQLTQ